MIKFQSIINRNMEECLKKLIDTSIVKIDANEYNNIVEILLTGGDKLKFYIHNKDSLGVDLITYE